jgi:hypothetical protein
MRRHCPAILAFVGVASACGGRTASVVDAGFDRSSTGSRASSSGSGSGATVSSGPGSGGSSGSRSSSESGSSGGSGSGSGGSRAAAQAPGLSVGAPVPVAATLARAAATPAAARLARAGARIALRCRHAGRTGSGASPGHARPARVTAGHARVPRPRERAARRVLLAWPTAGPAARAAARARRCRAVLTFGRTRTVEPGRRALRIPRR